MTLFVFACGGTKPKKESSIVNEGDTAPTCCCKTIPLVGEKDIQPVYTMKGRMECSTDHGDCVDDVQCNGSQQPASPSSPNSTPAKTGDQQGSTGVPPPPDLGKE